MPPTCCAGVPPAGRGSSAPPSCASPCSSGARCSQPRHHAGTGQGEYIGFFAASKDEGSLEESLPDPFDGDKRERYGLFTWALAQALRESAPSDFAALARRIAVVYAERPFPTPEFIGRLEQRGPW